MKIINEENEIGKIIRELDYFDLIISQMEHDLNSSFDKKGTLNFIKEYTQDKIKESTILFNEILLNMLLENSEKVDNKYLKYVKLLNYKLKKFLKTFKCDIESITSLEDIKILEMNFKNGYLQLLKQIINGEVY